jgi:hypothetical protein
MIITLSILRFHVEYDMKISVPRSEIPRSEDRLRDEVLLERNVQLKGNHM